MLVCVAAGGEGTRMLPVTRWLNKHLIPIGPGTLMLDSCIDFLSNHGFKDVTIVTGSKHATQICEHVGDGFQYGLNKVEYSFQSRPDGIAGILKRVGYRQSSGGILLILGDNYFKNIQNDLYKLPLLDKAACWEYDLGDESLAMRFGQIIDGKIVEKPQSPVHGRILTGLYYFPEDVFKYVEELEPSARGELEITDLLERYLSQGRLEVFAVNGYWQDLGEWNSLMEFMKRNLI